MQLSHVSYEWVMTYMNESRNIRIRHIAFVTLIDALWMRHVSYEWVMSRMYESCNIWIRRVTFLRLSWKIQASDSYQKLRCTSPHTLAWHARTHTHTHTHIHTHTHSGALQQHRPRMEKSHLKRHKLLVWRIVSMLTVLTITQIRLYWHYWYR